RHVHANGYGHGNSATSNTNGNGHIYAHADCYGDIHAYSYGNGHSATADTNGNCHGYSYSYSYSDGEPDGHAGSDHADSQWLQGEGGSHGGSVLDRGDLDQCGHLPRRRANRDDTQYGQLHR